MKFVATKKGMTTNFFHPFLLLRFLDPGWVKIRIRDKHPGSATLLGKGRCWYRSEGDTKRWVPLPVLGVGAGSFNQLGTALNRAGLWALVHGYHKKV